MKGGGGGGGGGGERDTHTLSTEPEATTRPSSLTARAYMDCMTIKRPATRQGELHCRQWRAFKQRFNVAQLTSGCLLSQFLVILHSAPKSHRTIWLSRPAATTGEQRGSSAPGAARDPAFAHGSVSLSKKCSCFVAAGVCTCCKKILRLVSVAHRLDIVRVLRESWWSADVPSACTSDTRHTRAHTHTSRLLSLPYLAE